MDRKQNDLNIEGRKPVVERMSRRGMNHEGNSIACPRRVMNQEGNFICRPPGEVY
jgi:hypothetical protein